MLKASRSMALGVVVLAVAVSLAVAVYVLGGAPDTGSEPSPLTQRLIQASARLYGALRLAQDDAASGRQPDRSTFASVHSALEYCRSLDFPALRSDRDFDSRQDEPLLSALEDSCFHIDAPALAHAGGEFDYAREFDEAVGWLGAALTRHDAIPTPPFERLPSFRDSNEAATREELTAFLENEVAVRLLDGLRRLTDRTNLDNCGRPCARDLDFGRNLEATRAYCDRSLDPASFRQEPGFDAAMHEQLLTALGDVCSRLSELLADTSETRAALEELYRDLSAILPPQTR